MLEVVLYGTQVVVSERNQTASEAAINLVSRARCYGNITKL